MKKISFALIGVLVFVGILAVTYQNGALASASNCKDTQLLFPLVTELNGFSTGLAISNTSMDPFGTANESGTCTLYFYGQNAPASFTTPTIAAGTQYDLSTVAVDFLGYVIANCNFRYAEGAAIIANSSFTYGSGTYTAEVLNRGNSCKD